MALANCEMCGKLFNRISRDICPDCLREEEEAFRKIQAHVRKHRGGSAYEISDLTDVPLATVLRFLRDGRLRTLGANFPITYPCQSCEALIETGLYCALCTQTLQRDISRAANDRDRAEANNRTIRDEADKRIDGYRSSIAKRHDGR